MTTRGGVAVPMRTVLEGARVVTGARLLAGAGGALCWGFCPLPHRFPIPHAGEGRGSRCDGMVAAIGWSDERCTVQMVVCE